jgi:O-antigen/teichoic acid export membrane protein
MSMADNILLGKLYSATILGTYVIAYNLAVLPLHGVGNAIVNVTFPAYAEIAGGEVKRLERAFVRVFATSSTLLTLATGMLLLLGNEIVVFLYGTKWMAAGIILRILALLVFFKGHAILVSPLLVSVRGIAPDAKIKLFEAAFFLVLLYPLTSKYGAIGAAWAGAIAFFVMMVNRLRVAALLLPDIAGVLVRTVLSAIIACVIGTTMGALAIGTIENVLVRLLFGGSVIAIFAIAAMWILSPQLRIELRRVFAILKTAKQRRGQNQPVAS